MTKSRTHAARNKSEPNDVHRFLVTFVDHDYGCNNADRTYEFRYESGMAFVNFLGQPHDSPMFMRARDGYGVYGVKLFDFDRPEGRREVDDREAGIDPDIVYPEDHDYSFVPSYSNKTVAVFVLDIRTHKSPWKTGSAAYLPDYEGDFLGERQWKWFETALKRSRASVNVVVNGLQVHANRFPNGNIAEAWGKFPRAQQRLFDALLQDGVQSPILISGDVHMTQMMRKDCVRKEDYDATPRPLVEMTTSGMPHSWGSITSPPRSDPKYKPGWSQRYRSFVARTMMNTMHLVCPWTDVIEFPYDVMVPDNGVGKGIGHALPKLQYNLEKNFGELEFDWEARTVTLRTMGENPDAPPLLMARYSMDQLSGRAPVPSKLASTSSILTSKDFMAEAEADQARRLHPSNSDDESTWICINHRGREDQMAHMMGHAITGVVLLFLVPFPLFWPSMLMLLLGLRRLSIRQSSLRCSKTLPSHP